MCKQVGKHYLTPNSIIPTGDAQPETEAA